MKNTFVLTIFCLLCAASKAQIVTAPAEPFSFLIGSCGAYEPFHGDKATDPRYTIYATMDKTDANFMIWTGDAVYYRFDDWKSYDRMMARNRMYRREVPHLQAFIDSRPNYSVWDDHDFGPDNSHGDQPNKDSALMVFKQFWHNPSYGTDSATGVFFNFKYQDAEFFLLDDRYYSDPKTGEMLGRKQFNWLKIKLRASTARFKFVISGTQFLPNNHLTESYQRFKKESRAFFKFLETDAIQGVVLMSGDIHQSNLARKRRKGTYPLYEFTCSPLTSSFIIPFNVPNKYRLKNTSYRHPNFGLVKFEGTGDTRRCTIELHKTNGDLVWKYDILAKEIE
jgi:alkaline phosphatase D